MDPDSPPVRTQPRGIYLLPNLLTTGCLFSGFYAIIAAIDGNFERAGMAVFIAMIFDGLDGRVARLTNTASAFGKEYDSLADMIAFGIAPAIVTYQWGVARIAEYGKAWYRFGWLAAFFYAAAAALRLAKFNSRVQDKRYFEGLPSPSAAAVVAAFLWMSSEWREPGLPGLILAFLITAAAGALMVSRFSYPSFKAFDLTRPVRFIWMVVVALVFVVIAPAPAIVLLVIFGCYALWAPLWWLWRRLRRSRRQERAAAAERAAAQARGAAPGLEAAGQGEEGEGEPQAVSRREQYLAALGVEVWTLRARSPGAPIVPDGQPAPPPAKTANTADTAEADAAAWEALEALRAQVAGCTRCELCRSRTQTVFGVGTRRAGLLVIGEAPGADEDRQGEPFVGRAGQLLNSMLRAVGQPRESVYIANVLKCRPPGNRDPAPAEVASCLPYLQRQIELLAPRVILVVGRIAAQSLLGTTETVGRLRGRVHGLGASRTPLIVTYHPAYLLRSPLEKRRAWSDLKLARAAMREA